jgi:2-polyprenyl-3-methyl-5-hydroxy-6-metoxy-1,4-benzoquinol methylase
MAFVETRPRETGLFFDRFWKKQEGDRVDRRTLQRWRLMQPELSRLPGKKVLDCGAGRGVTAALLAEEGFAVAACDVSSDVVALLKRQGTEAFVFDLEEDELERKYDAIFCLEVLQYLRYPEQAVNKLKQALNGGGILVISVPNEFHLLRRLGIFWGRTGWAGIQTPHIRFFDRTTARQLFFACRLEVLQTIPVTLCPPGKIGEGLAQFLAHLFPNLFSLSIIFFLRSADESAAG